MQCNRPKDIVIMLHSPVSEVSWAQVSVPSADSLEYTIFMSP